MAVQSVAMTGIHGMTYQPRGAVVTYLADGTTGNITQIASAQRSAVLLAGVDPIDVAALQAMGCVLGSQVPFTHNRN